MIFEPTDKADKVSKLEEFSQCKLENDEEDPSLWFLRLGKIVKDLQGFGVTKTEEDCIVQIVVNLPETHYSEFRTTLDKDFNDGTLNLSGLKKSILRYWKRKYGCGGSSQSSNLAMNVNIKKNSGGGYQGNNKMATA